MDNPTGTGQIVVGVDGSEPSIEALRYAADLAPSLDASVHAIACWHFPYLYAGLLSASDIKPYEDSARETLDQSIGKAFDGEPPVPVATSVLNGTAAERLISASEEAKMLILGRRGHGGFGGLQLGSVSNACIAHAVCPVLVVHGDNRPSRR